MPKLTEGEVADARQYNEDAAGKVWNRQELPWPFSRTEPGDDTLAFLTALYQIENNLSVDGMLGPNTWSSLTEAIEAGRYSPGNDSAEELSVEIPEVHLGEHEGARRHNEWARVYQLSHPEVPTRKPDWPAEPRVEALVDIIEWLDVENAERYGPTENKTYCNIYAYDVCCLAGVYFPRVWWTDGALSQLEQDKSVEPQYDPGDLESSTVREMNVNALFEWFDEYGESFGWEEVTGTDQLQNAANDGKVGLILAERDGSGSGHVTVVVPEEERQAEKDEDGDVEIPLQSQAGRTNRQYHTRKWWTAPRFADYSFWVHR